MGSLRDDLRVTPARVTIDLRALAANLDVGEHGPGPVWVDARRDAWGHGVAAVAATIAQAGAGLIVDPWQRELVAPRCRVRTDDVPDESDGGIDAATAYGLTGGGAAVMSLHGVILEIKDLRAGEGVSYGYTHRATVDTTVALVAGGYAQGVPRELGNRATVALTGPDGRGTAMPAPIIGRVAMDACVIEVGSTPCAPGDRVVFFGDGRRGHPTAAEWAAITGMTVGEIVSAAGARTQREVRR